MRGDLLSLVLVTPLVFRAPEGPPVGPGCSMRPWAAAHPRAVHAASLRPAQLVVLLVALRVLRAPDGPAAREAGRPHFARRRASKPARALRSLRRPPHRRCLRCRRVARRVGSLPGQAPAHGHRSEAFLSLRHPTGSDGGLAALGAGCRCVGGVSRF